jgi:hypothetical protein
MLQQTLFRNRRIQLPQQFRVPHDRSPPQAACLSIARAHSAQNRGVHCTKLS